MDSHVIESGDWKFTGEECAANAADGATSPSAPVHKRDSSTFGACRTT